MTETDAHTPSLLASYRTPLVGLLIVLLVFLLGTAVILVIQWPQLRERALYNAMMAGNSPEWWWPPSMRDELQTTFLLNGQVTVDGEIPNSGSVVYTHIKTKRRFETRVRKSGSYSYRLTRLPAGEYTVMYLAPGQSVPQRPAGSAHIMLDGGGRHGLNLAL